MIDAMPDHKVRTQHTTTVTLLLLVLLLIAQYAAAEQQTYQSLASIRQAAESHIAAQFTGPDNYTLSANKLDPRLRLKQCGTDLQTFSPPGRSRGVRRTVGVRCEGDNPWTLYVAVTVSELKQVAVSSRALTRGETLERADFVFEQRDVAGLQQGYFSRAEPLIGQQLKRSLGSGTLIKPTHLKSITTVKRGDKVTIRIKSKNIQIHASGTALQNGTIGDRIRVTNSSSGQEVEGIITGQGMVEVAF